MTSPREADTFTVTMLAQLRPWFEMVLAANGLRLVHIPDAAPEDFIVVPSPDRTADRPDAP